MTQKGPRTDGVIAANRRTYSSWLNMIHRCYNRKLLAYPAYGGRGITVCPQWQGKAGFKTFLADMGDKPTPKHTIERVDNDQGYSPDNCTWALQAEQNINQRHGFQRRFNEDEKLTYGGVTQTYRDWVAASAISNMSVRLIRQRVAAGWTVGEVLGFETRTTVRGQSYTTVLHDTPPLVQRSEDRNDFLFLEYGGLRANLNVWAFITGTPVEKLRERVENHWWSDAQVLGFELPAHHMWDGQDIKKVRKAAQDHGISVSVALKRRRRGATDRQVLGLDPWWSPARAKNANPLITHLDETKSLIEWANSGHGRPHIIRYRIKHGATPAQALGLAPYGKKNINAFNRAIKKMVKGKGGIY